MQKKNKLKIILCANSSWYIYNFRKNTILEFRKLGHRVIVVAPKDGYSKYFADLGAEYYTFNLSPRSINPFKEIFVIFSLMLIYLNIRPNFVMNFTSKMNIYSTLAAFLVGSKVINNISGLGTAFKKETVFSYFICLLYRFSQLFAIKVFFQNEQDMARFIYRKIIPTNKSEYIPGSGVDLKRFVVTKAPNDGVVRFTIICRMLYDKGIGVFAEAAKYCKATYGDAVEFRAVGFMDETSNRSVSKGVMNDWCSKGFLLYRGSCEDIRPEVAISDCIVLPSVYPEGTPKVLLEAAAMGKPIITTNMPGCSSVVDQEINGFLCNPHSLEDLIMNIEKLINMDHNQRHAMGIKSRELVEQRFDEKIVIEKYVKCLSL